MRHLWWIVGALVLLFPALHNGFPVMFFDTGAYIARAFQFDIEPGRGPFYGFVIALLHPLGLGLWPVIVAQSTLILWLIRLTLRGHDLPHGAAAVAATAGGLAVATGLAWFTAQVMPDILTPVVILATYLLAFRPHRLDRREQAGVAAALFLAVAVHMAHIALAAGLLLVTAAAKLWFRRSPESGPVSLWRPAVAIVAGILAIPTAIHALTGTFQFTPGGPTFVLGRLIQDGIVARFLADNCPSPEYRLCDYRDRLPTTADDWIWGDGSPFHDLGRWEGTAPEARRITLESLKQYPGLHLETALTSTWQQIISVRTGDGLDGWFWHTRYVLESHMPDQVPAYLASRQEQRLMMSFDALNRLHVPVALGSVLAAIGLLGWCAARRDGEVAALLGFMLIGVFGNAVICGVFSNPHDRYQSRVVWLITFAVIVAAQRLAARGHRTAGQGAA